MCALTTSWDLRWWPCQCQGSCRVPDRVCHLCSHLPACRILIYLHSSRLQTCLTCPRKWCPEDPCFHQIGSECLCLFLLVALLFIDIPLWDQRAWMTEKGGISEMGGQGLGAHPSTEGGGRFQLNDGPGGRVCWATVIDTNQYQDIWFNKDCCEQLRVQKLLFRFCFKPPEPFLSVKWTMKNKTRCSKCGLCSFKFTREETVCCKYCMCL